MPGGALLTHEMAGEIHHLPLLQTCFADIVRVQEDNTATVINAAVTITQTIDRRVELIVRTDRHHQVMAAAQDDAARSAKC